LETSIRPCSIGHHMRLVIGISGASGVAYGIHALQALKDRGVETHLILSEAARKTIRLETNYKISDVENLATETHRFDDITSILASGSFHTDGMAIIPCSMKTLGGVASGYADNLLLRAAAVSLKERRRLVLVVRESPLSLIDIENMAAVTRAGGVILPAMPSFYRRPKTVDEIFDELAGKALELLGVANDLGAPWGGPSGKRSHATSLKHRIRDDVRTKKKEERRLSK